VTNVHGSIANVSCEGCGREVPFDVFCQKVKTQIKDIYNVDPTAPKDGQDVSWDGD
jgi:NAD-dependent SIR2 family protein deacetylase